MKFERLRLNGFKSFVDASEFVIAPGLTGVVGPNGCGKSNLVEAMRWVMGESSYKAMRASGMDDVIFSGSGKRPSRNAAEVTLVLGNDGRTAPAAFNDADFLEVTRRIEREAGSSYRINGKEVRARDVQLLFADASTGARSPALVRQGQIGELIAAKPTQRRTILEEAAGISGLHSRRHDAELRLKGAETNLVRLEDVLHEIEERLDVLRRQARQAARYRNISADIRKAEATLAFLRLDAVEAEAEAAEADMNDTLGSLAEAERAQAEAVRLQAIAGVELPKLRDASAAASAALQRFRIALAESEAEERRTRERLGELGRRAEEIVRDRDREAALCADNGDRLAALTDEAEALAAEALEVSARRDEAGEAAASAAADLAAREADLDAAAGEEATAVARRLSLERTLADAVGRISRLAADLEAIDRETAEIEARLAADEAVALAREAVEEASARELDAEAAVAAAESLRSEEEERFAAARRPVEDAERELHRLDTEAATLAKMLNLAQGSLFPPLVDRLEARAGVETALAVALGDDIDAPLDARAPAHWSPPGPIDDDPPLPAGAEPLSELVSGPDLIARRLAQTGLVDRNAAPDLARALKPGQVLVTAEGDVWRWDGYVAAAGAPTPAARRLESKNRLAEIDARRGEAAAELADVEATLVAAEGRRREAEAGERAAREALKAEGRRRTEAQADLVRAERAMADTVARRASLAGQRDRVVADVEDATISRLAAEEALATLGDGDELAARVRHLRDEVAGARTRFGEARAGVEMIDRENELREKRRAALMRECQDWRDRAARAAVHLGELDDRLADVEEERAALVDRPDEILFERRGILARIAEQEAVAGAASDRLQRAERESLDADRRAAETLARLSEVREGRARGEERLAAARRRRDELVAEIRDRFDTPAFALAKLAEIVEGAPLPDPAGVEARLERLRVERERLGGVNLQAETEAAELEARMDGLVNEREDLIEAIRRLRQGILNLNREARERLLAAFDVVNAHFKRLFEHLFGGGTADLQLVDAEDPLEAGLEIVARPPGKKPQTMTLLSGGEQALTAMALIFAVFLTNPAPICVLDEVDAPLDDANVERYCDLLDEMVRSTETRFVVITHNPVTMARMDRLFGVTMAERGVSQLVSVDLETAESYREAS